MKLKVLVLKTLVKIDGVTSQKVEKMQVKLHQILPRMPKLLKFKVN